MRRAKVTCAWRHAGSGDWYEATALIPCADGERVPVTARGRLLVDPIELDDAEASVETTEQELRARIRARYPDVEIEF